MTTLRYTPCLLLVAAAAQAADYCSLSVKVVDASGKGVEARVIVEQRNGHKDELTSFRGSAEFCDLGITPVSVTVGDSGCNQVIVRNVPLEWGQTRNVVVTHDDSPCSGETLPVAACTFLLRFVNSDEKPVAAVSFKTENPPAEVYRGDEFGRIRLNIAAGEELLGAGSAAGYTPTKVSLPCVSKNQRLEQTVVLERSRQ